MLWNYFSVELCCLCFGYHLVDCQYENMCSSQNNKAGHFAKWKNAERVPYAGIILGMGSADERRPSLIGWALTQNDTQVCVYMENWTFLQYKDHYSWSRDYHHKDKMVTWPSYLYNENCFAVRWYLHSGCSHNMVQYISCRWVSARKMWHQWVSNWVMSVLH